MEYNQSATIKELVNKAQLFGLHKSNRLAERYKTILNSANKDKRLLTLSEIKILSEKSNCDAKNLYALQNELPELINNAKNKLLVKMPDITQPNGALYPKERAEACWRDCFHFARISIYGTATGDANITDQQGLEAVKELYKILGVPVNALALCLRELQLNCEQLLTKDSHKRDVKILNACFDHLISSMEIMTNTSKKKQFN